MKKKVKIRKSEEKDKYIWVIFYINRDFLKIVEEELKRYGYKLQTYIPTVKVIKKQFKGKNVFEFVPLLFNYGFIRVKYSDACNPEYLLELRSRISCIYGWVKDPINQIQPKLRRDNKDYIALPGAAFASDKEVSEMVKTADTINVYSSEELERFKNGDYIKLKGYPFDDIPAKILNINHKKKEVKVELLLVDAIVKEVKVSFENIFYTVYQGYDDSLSKDDNFDELDSRKKLDSMMFNANFYYEED